MSPESPSYLPTVPVLRVECCSREMLSPELANDRPDWHGMVYRDSQPAARCSLWWRRTPCHGGRRVGCLGHFFASDAAAADCLLREALSRLRQEGCQLAVGPMNGNTWRDYRWVTEPGDRPAFLLEPNHPLDYPSHLSRHGFQPVARYFSALTDQLSGPDSRLERARRRLAGCGVSWRCLRDETLADDILSILQVARVAFRNNPFYVEPDVEEFLSSCERLRQSTCLNLIQLALAEQRPIGFVFAVPDGLQAARQQTVDTVVVKTLATLPGRRYAGLGQVLLASVQHEAASRGFRQAIYALVRDVPHLRRISARTARPIRRYALYGKVLTS
jgi:GNAT superfamily N-acetyltransferase